MARAPPTVRAPLSYRKVLLRWDSKWCNSVASGFKRRSKCFRNRFFAFRDSPEWAKEAMSVDLTKEDSTSLRTEMLAKKHWGVDRVWQMWRRVLQDCFKLFREGKSFEQIISGSTWFVGLNERPCSRADIVVFVLFCHGWGQGGTSPSSVFSRFLM